MREPAKTFEDLMVWQRAHSFVLAVYHLSGTFPKHEIYGLASQFRRAAVSIAANIAEGFVVKQIKYVFTILRKVQSKNADTI